jgi:hypothetical protein
MFFIISIFISVFFNFYGNPNSEDTTVDSDYLIMSSLVEAEKEIGSIDDLISIFILMFFVFGTYFFIYSWLSINSLLTISMVYFSLTIVLLFIIGVPLMLLYDLGIYFLIYLRGMGKTNNILIESIFDYVTCAVFFSRVLSQ